MWRLISLLIFLPALVTSFTSHKEKCSTIYATVKNRLKPQDILSESTFKTTLDGILHEFFDPVILEYKKDVDTVHGEFNTGKFMTEMMKQDVEFVAGLQHEIVWQRGIEFRHTARIHPSDSTIAHVQSEMLTSCTKAFEAIEAKLTAYELEVRDIAMQLEKDRFLAMDAAFKQKMQELSSVSNVHSSVADTKKTALISDLEKLKEEVVAHAIQGHEKKEDILNFFKTKEKDLISKYAQFLTSIHGKVASHDHESKEPLAQGPLVPESSTDGSFGTNSASAPAPPPQAPASRSR